MLKTISGRLALPIFLTVLIAFQALAQSKLFTPINASSFRNTVDKEVGEAYFFKADKQTFKKLALEKPNEISFQLDLGTRKVDVKGIQSSPLSPSFKVTAASKPNVAVNYNPGAFYHGNIQNTDSKIAAVSFFPDGSAMAVLADASGNWVLGPLNDKTLNPDGDVYVFYNDVELKLPAKSICDLDDYPEMQEHSEDEASDPGDGTSSTCRKVTVYFECDNTMYRDNGNNVVNTTNFTTGLFNVVAQVYDNENIFIEISQIKVWDVPDPERSCTSSSCYLNAFNTRMNRDGFTGNLAHFLTTRNSGMGGIAWLPGLCSGNRETAFSNISNGYQLLPAYSWSVMVVAHELGHNFNSPHTQNCNWLLPNGRRGAIDSCYEAEGNCFSQTRARVGTVMSYCHLNGSININLGFGPLPGNRIRQSFRTGSCISGTEIIPQFFPASNSPLCSGDTLRLSTNLVPNATYRWTGPNGFTANTPIVDIANFNASAEGQYSLVVSRNGCDSRARQTSAVLNCLVIGHPTFSQICAGSRLQFGFSTKARLFGPDNRFNVEMSDGQGNFTNPTQVGSVASSSPTDIPVLIPNNTPSGTRYRFRISSTSPSNVGLDGGKNYVINTLGAAPNIADGFRCSPGVVDIRTTGSAFTFWFDSLHSTTALSWSNASKPFRTAFVDTVLTYIAQNSSGSLVSAGPTSNTIGNGSFEANPAKFLIFNITNTVLLDSITVFTSNTGTLNINLRDSLGTIMTSVTRTISTSGRNQVYVGMLLYNGRKYTFDAAGSTVSLFANATGARYPYNTTTSAVSITGNGDRNNGYPYFYGWKLVRTVFCPTAPKEVRAYITDIHPTVTPTISQVGDSLTVNPAGQSYQWFLEGNQISVNSRTFRPAQVGNYTVRLLVDSCPTPVSASFNYLLTSLGSLNNNEGIRLYPQPSGETINMESESWANQTINVWLIHLTGKILKAQAFVADARGTVNFDHQLPPGLYFIKASHKGKESQMKLLVD